MAYQFGISLINLLRFTSPQVKIIFDTGMALRLTLVVGLEYAVQLIVQNHPFLWEAFPLCFRQKSLQFLCAAKLAWTEASKANIYIFALAAKLHFWLCVGLIFILL